jgi:acylphosphatase
VRNLPDGRVHLVVEGAADEVQTFVNSINTEMGAYIHDAQVSARPATGRFREFEIRF